MNAAEPSPPKNVPTPLNIIVATDCGSTTTKAILIELVDGVYRQTYRGEAPTTVEAPFEDVTRGVLNAFAELEELSGRKILDGERIITPANGKVGVDIYVSTSSAGGGLQMMVAGVVDQMSARSAQRAALGAGAIVMDTISINDDRLPHEKIELIRRLRPDMILLAGGTDGGTVKHVVELAELIRAANPQPRLASSFRLPVIFAGNRAARAEIEQTLSDRMSLVVTENLRPVMERENLQPARIKIQDQFMEHVMAQAPGYPKLIDWVGAPIMPTPLAVGKIMETIANDQKLNLVGVDIGGATTDVFSVYANPEDPDAPRIFNRTVSANLGMSYSVSNVLAEAGLPNVLRWLPFDIDEVDVRDRIKNKMIRPTTIPQTLDELKLEHALSREALRLAFIQHCELAVGLSGVRQERDISQAIQQTGGGQSLVDVGKLDLLVGSGGVLSHAPRRAQTMSMLIDAFEPRGVTRLAVDSIFMMPHLGVLASVNPRAATEVFHRDCLIYLGTCISAAGTGKPGTPCLTYEIIPPAGPAKTGTLHVGEMWRMELGADQSAQVKIVPSSRFDVGAGPGHTLERTVSGGEVGLVLDARGRPLPSLSGPSRAPQLAAWARVFDAYPDD